MASQGEDGVDSFETDGLHQPREAKHRWASPHHRSQHAGAGRVLISTEFRPTVFI